MSEFRQTFKNLFPSALWEPLSETRYALQRAAQWPAAMLHPWRRESMARLDALEGTHRGERCFIIGNGPSLKETDVSLLKDEHTFGMNRIYLAFPEWGFRTSYLVSVNDLVIKQCVDDFLALDMPRFFSWRSRQFFPNLPITSLPTFLHTTYTGPKFAQHARGRLWEGATVTYVCLQLAFHMGFEKAILIGVDHSFISKGEANKTVISQGDDLNHFDPRYFGEGFRWQLPDLDTSEAAYTLARQAYESEGREVVDATLGGKLQVFPKVDYLSLFS
ncbi:MAG: 6-hydroxymethylpterin diphosphokinase MptE-like protein [Chloroflexota bacterium]|nr:6-hydroxymethylpterin diphosphokinase MptE-like protein [Chloroflexota bacterium]